MKERGWFAAFYEDLLAGVTKACGSRQANAVLGEPEPSSEEVPADSPCRAIGGELQPGDSIQRQSAHLGDEPADASWQNVGEHQPAEAPGVAESAGRQNLNAYQPASAPGVADNAGGASVARGGPSGTSTIHVPANSIGYQLLQAAGWREGRGLGAMEQGIASPVAAWHNQGRRGIGAASRAEQTPSVARAGPPGTESGGQAQPRQAEASAGGADAGAAASGAAGPGRPRRAPKRGWQTVAVEEALPQKVARVKQVMQAEADDAAGKALARAVYRAFSDTNGPAATDSNPLLRRNKLTATNPLL